MEQAVVRSIKDGCASCTRQGVQRGGAPLPGHGGVPVSGFITPFLARKGDGGMVETVVGHRRYRTENSGFEAKPRMRGQTVCG